jgi:hypothetical protein
MADGHTVYQGLAYDSPTYFKELSYQGSKFSNPADIFMKALSINYPKKQEDEEKLEKMITKYQNEQLKVVLAEMNEL